MRVTRPLPDFTIRTGVVAILALVYILPPPPEGGSGGSAA